VVYFECKELPWKKYVYAPVVMGSQLPYMKNVPEVEFLYGAAIELDMDKIIYELSFVSL
jgi:hypothetical protein